MVEVIYGVSEVNKKNGIMQIQATKRPDFYSNAEITFGLSKPKLKWKAACT